jgi:Sortase domain
VRRHARHRLGYRLRLRQLVRRSGAGAEHARVAATLLVLTCLAHGLAAAWLLDQPRTALSASTAVGRQPLTDSGAGAPPGISGLPADAGWLGVATAGGSGLPAGAGPPGTDLAGLTGTNLAGWAPTAAGPVPVGLAIPAIGVDEGTLVTLGRNPDGSLQVPSDYARAGWFTGGPVPGRPGPSVIAGHVDSRTGPAVFFRLRELRAGDVVTVRMSDGGQLRFRVDGVRQYPKANFPTAAVYGPVPGSALRLITCGGSFDRTVRSYRDNVVVYASRQP